MAQASFLQYRQLVRGANQFYQMLKCDCINGYAIGRKRVHGKATDALAITVFVNRKLSLRRLPLANRVPQVIRLPDDRAADGVLEFLTDVREASFQSLENTTRERPAPAGISVGHVAITAGTLGGLVRDRETGAAVILSNNHVLANSNDAAVGDAILQPGPHDGGTDPADRIATLTRFVRINLEPGAENHVDAAIATPIEPLRNQVAWSTKDIGDGTPAVARHLGESDLGLPVQKTGRTTEHTDGFVQSLFATVQVKYNLFQKATFVDQIIVSQESGQPAFSNGGDSGSLVYDAENRCVGLLFAGSEGSEGEPANTIINPIQHVLRELNVEMFSADPFPRAGAGRPQHSKKR